MKIALAQINTVVGDVQYNLQKAKNFIGRAVESGAELIVLPELLLTGYPPRDLLYREDLIDQNLQAKHELVELTKNFPQTLIFGYVDRTDKDGCKPLYNAGCVARNGQVIQTRFKTLLPTYDVFEEYRYFEPGPRVFKTFRQDLDAKTHPGQSTDIGIINCEESWNEKEFWPNHLYDVDPVAEMVRANANYLIVFNASPYRKGIYKIRHNMIARHAKKHGVGIAYCNQVGYNDEVGFDGNSFAVNSSGQLIAQSVAFGEDLLVFDTQAGPITVYEQPWQEEVLTALKVGIQDYFGKQNITGPAIIGLSGGIDSAIVAYLAVLALGKDRVIGVGMPSEFSSDGSVSDAEKIAKTLGIHFTVQPIRTPHNSIRNAVDSINVNLYEPNFNHNTQQSSVDLFRKKYIPCVDAGITDENLQARIRGIYLMALSNYYGGLVLSTGNKSEMAVGYCTLYGDMCGGLAVISDVFKTDVYDLCRYINAQMRMEIIPYNTIDKPPSAELRANQKDQDSLPPYWLLDSVLYRFVDQQKSPQQIKKELLTEKQAIEYLTEYNRMLEKDILWACNAVMRVEYKRKQAPTGLKISEKHFKYGWSQPVVHRLVAT